jgi:DNA-binding winged helix-turn-helix (wHTH) protein/AraC-like DNA-binding protein
MHGTEVHRKLRFDLFELSIGERVLRRDGQVLPIGGRALDILIYLADRPGEVIAKQKLIDHVWSDVTVEEGSLRVHVAAIRKALGDGQFGNRYIANIKGRGYSFVGNVVPLRDLTESKNVKFRHQRSVPVRQMIGRETIVGEVSDKLRDERFVTLLGRGGRGRTAIALAAGRADDTPPQSDLQQLVYLANNVSELLETAKRELERNRETAKASLATASSMLQSEIERRSRAKGARPGALAAWQIARVRAFIDENLHRTIDAKDLSAVAQRSTSHFSRSFKQVFGEGPHAYVVRRRLERARHLMITSSASLREIALSVGFFDQTHLSRLFRQAFGQSPSIWRRDIESRRG